MEITEVRVKLATDEGYRCKAFASITFDDCFVVRDTKIIRGDRGPFVAMPDRFIMQHCPYCECKNKLRANYCNNCGGELRPETNGEIHKFHADIAHPITTNCRMMIQTKVLEAYQGMQTAQPSNT